MEIGMRRIRWIKMEGTGELQMRSPHEPAMTLAWLS